MIPNPQSISPRTHHPYDRNLTAGFALAQQATSIGKLEGHTDPVYAVAWSPDGKSLATAGFDNTVRLWDAATRKEIKKLEGHTKLVLAVAISPDGKQILSGSQDNTAKIWDWPTFGPDQDFAGHPRAVQALAVKPDGKQVAAASGKSIKIWDLATGPAGQGTSKATPATCQSAAWRGDGSAARHRRQGPHDPALERPTSPGSHDRNTRRGRPRPGLSAQQPAARLGRLRRPGPALAASVAAASADSTRRGRSTRFALSAATAPSSQPPAATRSSGSWNPADGKLIKEITDRPAHHRGRVPAGRAQDRGRPSRTRACGSIRRATARRSRRSKGSLHRSPRSPSGRRRPDRRRGRGQRHPRRSTRATPRRSRS